MKDSSNRWLVTLLCLNALLITALVACHVELPAAQAQQVRSHNYLLVPGVVNKSEQVVWIIDQTEMKLVNCQYQRSPRRIKTGTVIDLAEELEQPTRTKKRTNTEKLIGKKNITIKSSK